MEGTISWFRPERGFGSIGTEDGSQFWFHESFVVKDDPALIEPGQIVSFDPEDSDRGPQARNVVLQSTEHPVAAATLDAEHENHCFVVMPFGRGPKEIRWFRGWYETVIEPALLMAEYHPILAANEQRPNAINDEIRAHLALDPMVVVDLAGASSEEGPNPNVMYELGIRHALNLPLVMMAWKGQRLPFDISNQRVIMEDRELLDLEPTKQKLLAFIDAAKEGHFYRPMEAVGRIATLDYASESLGRDSILGILAREVRDLRRSVSGQRVRPPRQKEKKPVRISNLLSKAVRRSLHQAYLDAGGDEPGWSRLVNYRVSVFKSDDPTNWAHEDWVRFVQEIARGDLTRLKLDEQTVGQMALLGTETTEGPTILDTTGSNQDTQPAGWPPSQAGGESMRNDHPPKS